MVKNAAQSLNCFIGSNVENVSVHEGSSLRWLEAEEVTHTTKQSLSSQHTLTYTSYIRIQ